MPVLSWITAGVIAGFMASLAVKGGYLGFIGDIIVGMLGGLLGGWLAVTILHINVSATWIDLGLSNLVAFGGAMMLIGILRIISDKNIIGNQ